jgi:hypothetical protein
MMSVFLLLEVVGVFEAFADFDSFERSMLLTDGCASSAGCIKIFDGLKPSGGKNTAAGGSGLLESMPV